MAKITSLQQQQRNKQRVSVFLDGEFAFGLPAIVAMSLRTGQELSESDIRELQYNASIEAAKQSAFRFISYRPRSSAELKRNLTEKGYEPEIIEIAMTRMRELEMLDDRKFAEYWIEQRETFKPRSHRAMAMELRQKGIAREIIDELLGEVDELESARRAAEKRLSRWEDLPEDAFRDKVARYLNGRGFHYGIIREVSDALWEEIVEGEE